MRNSIYLIFLFSILFFALGSSRNSEPDELTVSENDHIDLSKSTVDLVAKNQLMELNHPKREFRAAWVTTFSNLDWPSRRGLSSEEQKKEFIDLLNQFEKSKINAVIVQVRAAADAFYPSKIAPWSAWLTGEQGKAPSPYYDPLDFMIKECHKRNMEFHAWFNPLRGVSHTRFSNVSKNHISNTKKEWFFTYGDTKYFNPGLKEVHQHIVSVVQEVVSKYDIDGVHFDDYFYPYTIKNKEIPDLSTYASSLDHSFNNIQDWRRENINELVRSIADTIKKIKPYVKFGISPYAIWRNKKQDPLGSETNSGQTSFDNLYCDTKMWMSEGWVDYMAPQLYWSTSNIYANYNNLIDWWTFNNINRHLYIGHAIYKLDVNNKHSFETAELLNQVNISRKKSTVQGSVYFRADAFKKNHQDFLSAFDESIYKHPALIPKMEWIDSIPPDPPKYLKKRILMEDFVELTWRAPRFKDEMSKAKYFVIYQTDFPPSSINDLKSEHIISIQKKLKHTSLLPDKSCWYSVTAVDRLHNESEITSVKIK